MCMCRYSRHGSTETRMRSHAHIQTHADNMRSHAHIQTHADNMTKTHFNQRKEVFSISIANIIGGVCGGIPGTAALARTALNIKSGAKGRVSGVICAVLTMVLSVGLMPYFRYLFLFVCTYRRHVRVCVYMHLCLCACVCVACVCVAFVTMTLAHALLKIIV